MSDVSDVIGLLLALALVGLAWWAETARLWSLGSWKDSDRALPGRRCPRCFWWVPSGRRRCPRCGRRMR